MKLGSKKKVFYKLIKQTIMYVSNAKKIEHNIHCSFTIIQNNAINYCDPILVSQLLQFFITFVLTSKKFSYLKILILSNHFKSFFATSFSNIVRFYIAQKNAKYFSNSIFD